jgi:hypothetical protein
MDVFDQAGPRLREAHKLMHEVAQVCADDHMIDFLNEAMEANRDAQTWLTLLELHARSVSG